MEAHAQPRPRRGHFLAAAKGKSCSRKAFSTHEAPAGEARREAARKLQAHLKKVDGRTAKASNKEADEALDEALENVRPGYRDRK